MISPFVVTVVRPRRRQARIRVRAVLLKPQRLSLRRESARLFVIELLCFVLLAIISAWPLLRALEALRSL
jgi:hypothetical protein